MDLRRQFLLWATVVLKVFAFAEEDEAAVGGVTGDSVRLPCDLPLSSPPSVRWIDFVYNTDQNHPSVIFSSSSSSGGLDPGHENSADFEVDSRFALTISDLEVDSDPGSYICESRFNGTLFKRSYYLTVATKPECSGEVELREGSRTVLQCKSEYSGNQPMLHWFRGESERLESEDNFEIRLAKRSLNITATHKDDGTNYTCRLKIGKMVAECRLQLSVKYRVRDVRLTPDRGILRVGDEVNCSAIGNPFPTFSLEPIGSKDRTGEGWKSIAMQPEWQDKQVTVKCIARNSVDGLTEVVESNITVAVIEAPGFKFIPALFIVIVVVVLGLASLVVVVIIILVIRRKNRREHKERS